MLLTIAGAMMTIGSATGLILRKRKKDYFIEDLQISLETHGIIDEKSTFKITKYTKTPYGYSLDVTLPRGITVDKFRKSLAGIEQDLWSKIRFQHIFGRDCKMEIGRRSLDGKINYGSRYQRDGLKIPFVTHFGTQYLDFYDEASWHLLIAGAARTGKTALLRLIIGSMLKGSNGDVDIYLSSVKDSDFYMYRDSIHVTDNVEETHQMLEDVLAEAVFRKQNIKAKGDVFDLKHFREKYPEDKMNPIFVIIDEYARLSEDEEIQNKVMELIETYSYVDIHIVLATQRPDATTVLKPRIRANILARVALTCADEANSRLVLGNGEAAHLGGIRGRAVLQDGSQNVVQIPYMNPEQCEEIGREYKRHVDKTRQSDNTLFESLSCIESQSIGDSDMFGCEETNNDR